MTQDHDPDVARVLNSISETRRQNAALSDNCHRLGADLAQATQRVAAQDTQIARLSAERDYYMRHAVELQAKLNDAAVRANDMAKSIGEALESAKQEAYRPNGAVPAGVLQEVERELAEHDYLSQAAAPVPGFLRQGPAQD